MGEETMEQVIGRVEASAARHLEALAKKTGKSRAELVRTAVMALLGVNPMDKEEVERLLGGEAPLVVPGEPSPKTRRWRDSTKAVAHVDPEPNVLNIPGGPALAASGA